MEKIESGNLKYFYELPPNETGYDNPTWLSYPVEYNYNNDGLNNTKDYLIEKPKNTYRIITLGDSFVYGMFVNTQENFSEKLETLLNSQLSCPGIEKFEILNFGIPGYDLQYEIERFITRGLKYNPDLLLWYIRDDDFFINNEQFIERQHFYEQVLSKDKTEATIMTYEEFYKNWFAISDSTERRKFIQPEIDAFPKLTQSFNGGITVFTFKETPQEYKNYIYELILPYPNITYFDDISNVNTFAPSDYHPTPQGHTTIAQSLFNHLIQTKLSSCKIIK